MRDLTRRGVRTAEEAYRRLGVEMNCVGCSDYVQIFIDEAVARLAAGEKTPPGGAASRR